MTEIWFGFSSLAALSRSFELATKTMETSLAGPVASDDIKASVSPTVDRSCTTSVVVVGVVICPPARSVGNQNHYDFITRNIFMFTDIFIVYIIFVIISAETK